MTRRSVRGLIGTLAVAMTAAVLGGCGSSASGRTGAGAAQFVGFRWRIGEVRHDGNHVTIPAGLRGYVAFARDHTLIAGDSVNGYFGHYRVGNNQYRPVGVGTTLVGYVGHDPARASLIQAVRALTQSNAAVAAEVDGTQLRLAVAGYTITCFRLSTAPNQLAPSPTPTRT